MTAAETFPRDYVERLRAENKELRLRAAAERLKREAAERQLAEQLGMHP
jgi:hypothetical protein